MARRDELAPWVCGFHEVEGDRVAAALLDMLSGFTSMSGKSDEQIMAKAASLRSLLRRFPFWAIERFCDRVRERGYTKKTEDGRYVQERHWAPSDPEIFQMVEEECAVYARAHASAVALLAAEVSPDYRAAGKRAIEPLQRARAEGLGSLMKPT